MFNSQFPILISTFSRLIHFLQVNPGVIGLQDLLIASAVHRHTVCSDLTHADAVSPPGTVERHADESPLSIPLFVKVEHAVSQSQQRAQPQCSNRRTAR